MDHIRYEETETFVRHAIRMTKREAGRFQEILRSTFQDDALELGEIRLISTNGCDQKFAVEIFGEQKE